MGACINMVSHYIFHGPYFSKKCFPYFSPNLQKSSLKKTSQPSTWQGYPIKTKSDSPWFASSDWSHTLPIANYCINKTQNIARCRYPKPTPINPTPINQPTNQPPRKAPSKSPRAPPRWRSSLHAPLRLKPFTGKTGGKLRNICPKWSGKEEKQIQVWSFRWWLVWVSWVFLPVLLANFWTSKTSS